MKRAAILLLLLAGCATIRPVETTMPSGPTPRDTLYYSQCRCPCGSALMNYGVVRLNLPEAEGLYRLVITDRYVVRDANSSAKRGEPLMLCPSMFRRERAELLRTEASANDGGSAPVTPNPKGVMPNAAREGLSLQRLSGTSQADSGRSAAQLHAAKGAAHPINAVPRYTLVATSDPNPLRLISHAPRYLERQQRGKSCCVSDTVLAHSWPRLQIGLQSRAIDWWRPRFDPQVVAEGPPTLPGTPCSLSVAHGQQGDVFVHRWVNAAGASCWASGPSGPVWAAP